MTTTKKHIAFYISSFRPGGGEKQMVEIANAFANRGHFVDLLVLKPVGQLQDAVDPNVRVVTLDAGRIIFSLPKLAAYLRKEKPETLLSVDEYTHTLALTARALTGVKTRIILRIGNMLSTLAENYQGKAKILPYITSWLFKKADAIIANSRGVADDVVTVTGIGKEKVIVIYNPKRRDEISQKASEPVSHPWFTQKFVPIILGVGRLRVQKNFPLLIRAFSKIIKEIPCRLVIIGAGREEKRLLDLIHTLGISEHVSLPGYSDNPYSYMEKADVFVLASLWEGLPNSLLEAMACGAPVIAADCSSGPREIVAPDTDYRKRLSRGEGVENAKYGVLFAVDDEAALVDALRHFLTDGEFRKKYADLSKERSIDFDSRDIVGEYARVMGI
jgi:glycosyltransferase involved in cell wall biosynthesis